MASNNKTDREFVFGFAFAFTFTFAILAELSMWDYCLAELTK